MLGAFALNWGSMCKSDCWLQVSVLVQAAMTKDIAQAQHLNVAALITSILDVVAVAMVLILGVAMAMVLVATGIVAAVKWYDKALVCSIRYIS